MTGTDVTEALLFVSGRDVVLITDFRYQTQITHEVGDLARISIEAQSLWAGVWQQLAALTYVEVIGFESFHSLRASQSAMLGLSRLSEQALDSQLRRVAAGCADPFDARAELFRGVGRRPAAAELQPSTVPHAA